MNEQDDATPETDDQRERRRLTLLELEEVHSGLVIVL